MLLTIFIFIGSKPSYSSSIDQKYLKVTGQGEEIKKEDVSEVCSLENLETLEIGPGITSIGASSFKNAQKLKEITFISDTLKSIGSGSFANCKSLMYLTLPEGLEIISSQAFQSAGLVEVTFPSTLRSFSPSETFIWCYQLVKFKMLKQGLFSASKHNTFLILNQSFAYSAAFGVKSIEISDEIVIIGEGFANNNQMSEIIFSTKGNLKEIQIGAFSGTSINIFNLPEGIEKCYSISTNAKEVYLPSTLIEIGSVFSESMNISIHPNCKAVFRDENGIIFNGNKSKILLIPSDLSKLTIPIELYEIERNVIQNAKELKEIEVKPNHPKYYSYLNGLYLNKTNELFAYPISLTEITIYRECVSFGRYCFQNCNIKSIRFEGNKLKSIGYASFENCKIEALEMPNSVTTVESYCMTLCYSLKSIKISPNITSVPSYFLTYSLIEEVDLSKCTKVTQMRSYSFISNKKLHTIKLPPFLESLGPNSFESCISLDNVFVPSSVQTIGESCFIKCSNLSHIEFGKESQLEIISFGLFEESGLKSIIIPKSVQTISQGSFSNCPNLTSIQFEEESNLTTIQKSSFVNSNKIRELILPKNFKNIIPQSLTEMYGLESFEISNEIYKSQNEVIYSSNGETLVVFPGGIKEYTVTGNVRSIAESAFFRCKMLETLIFDPNLPLKEIGENTFMECIKLKSISIPSQTEFLAGNCFSDCRLLEYVTFAKSSSLGKIGSGCFKGCKGLKKVEFGENSSLSSIEESAFADCELLESFSFPRTTLSIGASAFSNCKSIQNIEFDMSGLLEKIDINAFNGCDHLYAIDFPSRLELIGTDAFSGCSNLHKIVYCGFNAIKGNAFPELQNAVAYVRQNYPSEMKTFGGLPIARILDESCFFPTFRFTAVLDFREIQAPILATVLLSDFLEVTEDK